MTTSTPTAPAGRSWRLARLTAPMARGLAGRRFFPLWAVVHHRGRKTGRALSVPVAVQATPDAFLIALPWGPGTNWVRNVQAAGGCVVRWRGVDREVSRPELLGRAEARPYFGRWEWQAAERLIGVEWFLLVHRNG
jgi:deazaflavin-dependent oxidoreductase (nitroreductase family)